MTRRFAAKDADYQHLGALALAELCRSPMPDRGGGRDRVRTDRGQGDEDGAHRAADPSEHRGQFRRGARASPRSEPEHLPGGVPGGCLEQIRLPAGDLGDPGRRRDLRTEVDHEAPPVVVDHAAGDGVDPPDAEDLLGTVWGREEAHAGRPPIGSPLSPAEVWTREGEQREPADPAESEDAPRPREDEPDTSTVRVVRARDEIDDEADVG
jgi:hypothetical protein